MWPFKKKKYVPRAKLQLGDEWMVARGEYDARPLVMRMFGQAGELAGHPEFSHQVGVAIQLKQPDSNGFPGPAETAQLEEIEDGFYSSFCAEREALMMAVISTAGMREYVFYTSDPDATRRKCDELQKRIAHHELRMTVQHDPKWSILRRLMP